MRPIAVLVLMFLAACVASADPEPSFHQGIELHGAVPDEPSALPDFSALDQAGQARGAADLVGRPHVLWFFPMVGTPG